MSLSDYYLRSEIIVRLCFQCPEGKLGTGLGGLLIHLAIGLEDFAELVKVSSKVILLGSQWRENAVMQMTSDLLL